MKTIFAFLLLLVIGSPVADANIINWTNIAGGNWSGTTNWSPNQVPGSSDDVVITTNGSYTVTLDTSPTINSLTVGGASGTQTVAIAGYTLTLNNASVVNANGILSLNGGTLSGIGPYTINGQLNWTNAGLIAAGSTLTVGTNGTLVLAAGNSGSGVLRGVLTNAGTIKLVSGTLSLETFGGGLGELVNLPGALVDIQANDINGVLIDGDNTTLIVNEGTMRKSAGTGTSTINPILDNTGSGVVDAQTGTIIVGRGDTTNSTGVYQSESGATLDFNSSFTAYSGVQFNGFGTNVITGGTFTFNGLVTISNLLAAGGVLAGTNGVIAGTLNCANTAQFAPGGTLTIATNGTLMLVAGNSGGMSIRGVLTNAGTIKLVSGTLSLETFGGGLGELVNLPGALVDIQANDINGVLIDGDNTTLIVNEGTMRKSAGTGTSTISPILNNTGMLDAQTGTISLSGSYSLTNGTLNCGISSLVNYGIINLSGSPAKLAGTLSVNLNNGYVPATGNSFTLLTYGLYTGLFANTILPNVALWQTNYGPTSFTISVTSVSMLAFTNQPVGGVLTNKIMAPVVVQVENPFGNPVATNGVPVTISLSSGSGIMNGTLIQNTDPTGKATFSDLSFSQTGTKTLLASNPALSPATSVPFRIVPLFDVQWTGTGPQLGLYGTNSLGSTIIFASTNLISWTPIYTNGPTNGVIIFLDTASTNFPHRFYRTLQ